MKVLVIESTSALGLNKKMAEYKIVRVINTHVHVDHYKNYNCRYVAFIEID